MRYAVVRYAVVRIIINADDFGFDTDTVAATVAAFEQGHLTSASIMVQMPATSLAFAYARTRRDLSFGVHLTFVCDTVEAPVSAVSAVPSLVRPDGRFMPSNRVRLLALRNRLPVAEIAREIEAQLALARDNGIGITHVDSHGHLHKYRPFRRALEQVLPRFGIRRVRRVQNLFIRRPWRSPTYWMHPLWGRQLLRRFATTGHFFMPATAGDSNWADALLRLPLPGTVEVGLHPGRVEAWRASEAAAAAELARLARDGRHRLVTWCDVGT